jgi:hypothetical protein
VVLTNSISHYTFSVRFVKGERREILQRRVCAVKIDNSNAQDRNKTYEGQAEEEGRWDKS